jgi:hypothetical protein
MPVRGNCPRRRDVLSGAVVAWTQYKDPAAAIRERMCPMGDRGKKDKDKARKQKIIRQEQSAKKAQEKVLPRNPLQKA